MKKIWLNTIAAGLVALGTTGCIAPLVVGGALAGGVLVANDRRTSGAQVEDQGIELRAFSRLQESIGDRAHINVTSYNRQVLLTGEVPSERDKVLAEQIVAKIDNVKTVVNELGVLGNSNLSARSSDTVITSRVKTALIEDKDVMSNAFKLVTERGVVYMMGRVTKREADYAANIVRGQSGVQKVVRVLELISEEDLESLLPKPAPQVEMKSTPVLSGSGQPVMTQSSK